MSNCERCKRYYQKYGVPYPHLCPVRTTKIAHHAVGRNDVTRQMGAAHPQRVFLGVDPGPSFVGTVAYAVETRPIRIAVEEFMRRLGVDPETLDNFDVACRASGDPVPTEEKEIMENLHEVAVDRGEPVYSNHGGDVLGRAVAYYAEPVMVIRTLLGAEVFVPARTVRSLSEDEMKEFLLREREARARQRESDANGALNALRELLREAADEDLLGRLRVAPSTEEALRRLAGPDDAVDQPYLDLPADFAPGDPIGGDR